MCHKCHQVIGTKCADVQGEMEWLRQVRPFCGQAAWGWSSSGSRIRWLVQSCSYFVLASISYIWVVQSFSSLVPMAVGVEGCSRFDKGILTLPSPCIEVFLRVPKFIALSLDGRSRRNGGREDVWKTWVFLSECRNQGYLWEQGRC